MANSKVADLTPATTPLAGTELVYLVQGGADRQGTAQDVADLAAGGATEAELFASLTYSFALKKGELLAFISGDPFEINGSAVSGTDSAHSGIFRGAAGGKWYFEILVSGFTSGQQHVGVVQESTRTNSVAVGGGGTGAGQTWGFFRDGRKATAGGYSAYGSAWTNSVISVAVDMTLSVCSRKIWFAIDGVWQNSGDPAAGTGEAFANLPLKVSPGVTPSDSAMKLRLRTTEFSYAEPAGYLAWL